jgi:hypothetical protein
MLMVRLMMLVGLRLKLKLMAEEGGGKRLHAHHVGSLTACIMK